MNRQFITLLKIYDRIVSCLCWPQSLLLLFLRLIWGYAFFQTGWGKLHRLGRVSEFFASLGIPEPAFFAVLVGFIECIGGVLLMLGLASRLIAIPLSIDMIIAYFAADRDALLKLFSPDYEKFFEAAPWPFLLVSVLVLFFGPGRLSIDALIRRMISSCRNSENLKHTST